MNKILRIGTRDSKLALVQTEIVAGAIRKLNPGLQVELVTMKTTGDKILDRTLDKVGGKGLFVKELDEALLSGQADLTVHSYKDMPMELNPLLPVVALSSREDPRDCLVLPENGVMGPGPIGSSSLRRRHQLPALFPGYETKPVRGNVLTRLRKLEEEGFSALVLAVSGMKRLGLENRISRVFTPDEMIPAASQGILAVQGRAGEDYSFLAAFDSAGSRVCSAAERAFVRALDGGCSTPTAAYAELEGGEVILRTFYVAPDGRQIRRKAAAPIAGAEALGIRLAKETLLAAGTEGRA